MGLLEQIAADVAEIKAALAGGATAAPAATETKTETAAQKKAREKAEAAAKDKPSFTAEELRDKYLAVQAKHGDAAAKALIAEAGYDKLAKLIADAAKWQNSWDLAEAKLAEDAAEDEEDNGGL
jgi:hypothetical protein